MAKDPAFLLYSKDFYEGTRMMLPEERGCYIDLMIYQHQNGGSIPNEPRRLTMYCSGCSEALILEVLKLKFQLKDNQWSNQKLNQIIELRKTGKPKKIAAACFAGLISKCGLNNFEINKIKRAFNIDKLIFDQTGNIISDEKIKEKTREWFKHMANQMVEPSANNLAIANAIANESINENKEKGGVGEKTNGLPDLNLADLEIQIYDEVTWRETICRNMRETTPNFTMVSLQDYLDQFFKILQNDGTETKSLKDFKKHFSRWLLIEVKKRIQNENKSDSNSIADRAYAAVDEYFGNKG